MSELSGFRGQGSGQRLAETMEGTASDYVSVSPFTTSDTSSVPVPGSADALPFIRYIDC
jgi:hypothetical protein